MMMNKRNSLPHRRGVSLLYTVVIMLVLLAFCSLGVDVARVQMAKTQMRTAVDAAARAGAIGLDKDTTTAISNAVDYAAMNTVDIERKPLVLVPSEDVFLGTWNASNRTFTKLTGFNVANANAVQVIGRRTAARGTAIPLSFAQLIGQPTSNINGMSAIAMVTKSINVNQNVPATANPFLAGMPKGSTASLNNPHNSPDYAGDSVNPKQSPLQVAMGITGGSRLTFDSISGDARHDPNLAYYAPDGQLTDIGNNTNGSENGISDLKAPINALVGVFLSDDKPSLSAAPSFNSDDLKNCPTDVSSTAARNMTTYAPKLKQLFFIGDGRTDDGGVQQFVAPPGATRLYLATWDFYEWNNNAGARNIQVIRPA